MSDEQRAADVEETTKPRKADKPLPTTRIGLAKQFEILRAYGALFVAENRSVKPAGVASVVDMHPDTVRLTNSFFLDCGLLQKADAGGFLPHGDVIAFARAHEWKTPNPEHKLQPVLSQTWFGKAISTRLSFRGSMEETEVIGILAEAANATPAHLQPLLMVIGFMEVAGLLTREGNMVRAVRQEPKSQDADRLGDQKPPQPPPADSQVSTSTQMRMVKLPNSKGTLVLSGDFNALVLKGTERKLVYEIIDLMDAFESSGEGKVE